MLVALSEAHGESVCHAVRSGRYSGPFSPLHSSVTDLKSPTDPVNDILTVNAIATPSEMDLSALHPALKELLDRMTGPPRLAVQVVSAFASYVFSLLVKVVQVIEPLRCWARNSDVTVPSLDLPVKFLRVSRSLMSES